MSYQQLMEHAYDIRDKAIKYAAVETAIAITAGRQPHLTKPDPSQIGWNRPDHVVLTDRQMLDIKRYFAEVPDWFEPFSKLPDPGSFDPAIKALNDVLGALSSTASNTNPVDRQSFQVNDFVETLAPLQEDLRDWTGDAADDFRNNFLVHFASVTANNFKLAAALKSALEAEKVLWEAARRDIDEIAEKTITALDDLHEMSAAEWDIMWAVVGAAIGVISIPLTGGLSVAAAVAAGAAGVMSAGAFAPDDVPSTPFSAGESSQVIDLMVEAIRKLTRDICTAEAEIAMAVRQANRVLAAHQEQFISRRPALAGVTANEIKSERYMGHEE